RGPHESGVVSGQLVVAPRMQVLIACEAEEPRWVVADDALRERLETRCAELVDEPGEAAFPRARRSDGPAQNSQRCRVIPARFRLDAVREYREASAEDCH